MQKEVAVSGEAKMDIEVIAVFRVLNAVC